METLSFEEILARDGKLVYKTRGVSMLPMLRQNRDLVVIVPPSGKLKRYDAALYKRGGQYILHRVIDVRKDGYVFRGDNTVTPETGITDADIVGVLRAFIRDGKMIPVTDLKYRLYVRFWHGTFPVRTFRNRIIFGLWGFLQRFRKLFTGR